MMVARVFADCARATYRVKCKPTLQNCGLSTRTITHPSQAATFRYRRADQARSRLLCIRRINGSGGPLGRESQAECFVNSWKPVERRAEGANRVQGFRSEAAALQDEATTKSYSRRESSLTSLW